MIDEIIKENTAKLAKKKGFDDGCTYLWGVLHDYNGEEYEGLHMWDNVNHLCNEKQFSAPTQARLQRWLRETHYISVEVNYKTFGVTSCNGWYYSFMHTKKQARIGYRENGKDLFSGYATYEQAMEDGLRVGLSLILELNKRYRCKLCGRDKFTRKSPHNCKGGYRKHHIIWEEITNENEKI